MVSSAGHIDPKKNGITICEAFGAYGWQEGLKLMKWLTDHLCVRGVNSFIPHAFSPRHPDDDCPPHFYARGSNPQWRYFKVWSGYANRLCHLLTGGRHIAPIAVIYHAEAEWSGKYMPFEKVVKVLAMSQVDCDIIPIDTITGMKLGKRKRLSLAVKKHWDCSVAEAEGYPKFEKEIRINGPGNVAVPGLLPKFSGTLRYECIFQ